MTEKLIGSAPSLKEKSLSSKICAVTGGGGLIGLWVTAKLEERGFKVVVVDDFSKSIRKNIESRTDAEIRSCDLTDRMATARVLDGIDTVFHLASRAYGIGYSSSNHLDMFMENECITSNLMHSLAINSVKRLISVSSSCIYPDTLSHRYAEGDEPHPINPEKGNFGYGSAKHLMEKRLGLFCQLNKISHATIRPFNIYGENYYWVGDASQVIPMLTHKIGASLGNSDVEIWGDGSQVRSFLHASDAGEAIVSLGLSEAVGVFNLFVGEEVSISELAHMIFQKFDFNPRIIWNTSRPVGTKMKVGSDARIREVLPDFAPSVSLNEGIERMAKWYLESF